MKYQKKIRFVGAGDSHKNWAAYHAIKTVVTMKRVIFMHAKIRCPGETLSADLCPMAMDYDVWIYNRIPYIQYSLSDIDIWSRLGFEPVSDTPSNCHVWGFPTYILEPKFHKPGGEILSGIPGVK